MSLCAQPLAAAYYAAKRTAPEETRAILELSQKLEETAKAPGQPCGCAFFTPIRSPTCSLNEPQKIFQPI